MQKDNVIAVDIGGGQVELRLELMKTYPHLKKEALILREFNADANYPANITAMEWNFCPETSSSIQPKRL